MAEGDYILNLDYNITKAEAKIKKLKRTYDVVKKEIENKKFEIEVKSANLEKMFRQVNSLSEQRKKTEKKIAETQEWISKYEKQGSITSAKKERKKLALYEQELAQLKKLESQTERNINSETVNLKRQEIELEKIKNKQAEVGEQIVLNGKNQEKTTRATERTNNSFKRFGRRIKSLIASALLFSLITKAFTALRNEFGKLLTETGTKTAKLTSQLKGNLATIGRTLYESARPYIEWLLQKLVELTKIIAIGLANALGQDVKKMAKLAQKAKETAKSAEKATASFDTLQKIDTTQTENNTDTGEIYDFSVSPDDIEIYKKKFGEILDLVTEIGIVIGAWKASKLFSKGGGNFATFSVAALMAQAIRDTVVNWDEIKKQFSSGWGALTSAFNGDSETFASNTLDFLESQFINTDSPWVKGVKNIANSIAGYDIFGEFKKKLDDPKEKEAMKKTIKKWGDYISETFFTFNPLKTIKNSLKALGNLFGISGKTTNKLTGGIAGGLSAIFGSSKTKSVPALATGAILPGGSPMLAWVNDQPKGQPYVEGSIDNIAAAFEKYLGSHNFGSQNFTIEAKGNWAQFIKWMNLQIKQEDKRASLWR